MEHKTLMDYAEECKQEKHQSADAMRQINYARMKKKVLLPFELVGFEGKHQTECCVNEYATSSIDWNFQKVTETPITYRQKRIWKEFIGWLSRKRIQTNADEIEVEWKWMMSEDEKYVKIKEGDISAWFKRKEEQRTCERIDEPEECERMHLRRGVLGRLENGEKLRVLGIGAIRSSSNDQSHSNDLDSRYHTINQAIESGRAVAASDASMEGRHLATHWILTTLEKEVDVTGGVCDDQWDDGLMPSGEGVGILELIKQLVKNTASVDSGELIMFADNKYAVKGYYDEKNKESDCTREAGGIIEAIRREVKKLKYEVALQYSNTKANPTREFETQPGPVLMKRCDEKSKENRKKLQLGELQRNAKNEGEAVPILNGNIRDKSASTLIREIDAIKHEEEAAKEVGKDKWEWLDVEARNSFAGGVGIGTLKCVTGFNHHGRRGNIINNGLCSSKCPRCEEHEDWSHVVKCEGIHQKKEACVKDLNEAIKKEAKTDEEKDIVEMVVMDIKRHIGLELSGEYFTTQHIIGMKCIFRGWVVKNWRDVRDEQTQVMKQMNKIIVKKSVNFYSEAWKHRNEVLHCPEKYKEYVIDWHKKIVRMIESSNKPEMIRYLRMQRIDVSRCSNACIRNWNMLAMKMHSKAREEVLNDIRNYFRVGNA